MVPEHITRYFRVKATGKVGFRKRKVWTVRATVESPKSNTGVRYIHRYKNKDDYDYSQLEREVDGRVAGCP
jgi:hypothetical protein